jgi:DNA replication ATP-dependent helicase Dna2
MNVSFTRARCKLVIFGSRKTLQREPLLAQFFGLMELQGWILALPAAADAAHARVFDGCSTPVKRPGITTGKENRRVKRIKY